MGMSNDAPRPASQHPNPRMQPGGDLYRRPLTAEEMAAPLTWAEQQLACVWRYGVLPNGLIGYAKISERLAPGAVYRASLRP